MIRNIFVPSHPSTQSSDTLWLLCRNFVLLSISCILPRKSSIERDFELPCGSVPSLLILGCDPELDLLEQISEQQDWSVSEKINLSDSLSVEQLYSVP